MLRSDAVRNEQVLMIVKTYPTPSERYGELVCTAGIRLRDNQWIRIYPYPFRQLKTEYRFRKYDVIEAPIIRADNDPRPDSYRLHDPKQVKQIKHIASDQKFWTQRMQYIRPTAVASVEAFKQQMIVLDEDNVKQWRRSILPVPVKSGSAKLDYEYNGAEWDKKDANKLGKAKDFVENNLFPSEEMVRYFQILERVPYRFKLSFEDLTGQRYRLTILDWEIPQLYFNVRQKESDDAALEKVRFKIEEKIFSERNEVFLILGSIHHRYKNPNSIAIDGFIYPKKNAQPSLF